MVLAHLAPLTSDMTTLNVCQFGHDSHQSKIVATKIGPLHVWNWEKYRGLPNYCPGQCDVSMSLDLHQTSERADIARFAQILDEQPGTVLDFGSHIGWYTVHAGLRHCDVFAVDSDPENMRLLHTNCEWHGIDLLGSWLGWIGDGVVLPGEVDDGVRVLKSDVEGMEWQVLDVTRSLWQDRLIDYGLWELSPVFENREVEGTYADLVDEIASYGYRWVILKDEGEWEITGADLVFEQENAWAIRL